MPERSNPSKPKEKRAKRSVRSTAVEVAGEVRATDVDASAFILRLDDGTRIRCRFQPKHELTVTEALYDHARRRLRVIGRSGRLQNRLKTMSADEIRVEDDGLARHADSRPIWDKIVKIPASVPREEWAKVPPEASVNLDHYLYGAPKRKQ